MSNLTWLNPTPHTIAVYASQPPSRGATQHSLPSGRYSLLGPDFHRLDRTSFSWRTLGRIEARTGLRMMPTFPRSPLSFRTVSFPQYGWKAGLSDGAFPHGVQLKPAPGIRWPSLGLR